MTEHIWREGLSLRYAWEAEFEKKGAKWTPKELWGEGFVAGVELMRQYGSFEKSIELLRENRELKAILQSIVLHYDSDAVTRLMDLEVAIGEARGI